MEKPAVSIMKPQLRRIKFYLASLEKLDEHIRDTEGQIVRLEYVLESLGEHHSLAKYAGIFARRNHSGDRPQFGSCQDSQDNNGRTSRPRISRSRLQAADLVFRVRRTSARTTPFKANLEEELAMANGWTEHLRLDHHACCPENPLSDLLDQAAFSHRFNKVVGLAGFGDPPTLAFHQRRRALPVIDAGTDDVTDAACAKCGSVPKTRLDDR
ncbi:ferritin-like domain-containing protein [Rhizobium sp. XQZ8]|nr:ferritin-like domain-containing protein [Rhizobium populisoli]